MALGEYRPPNQIAKDEDKYWNLTKTQLAYAGIGLFVGFLLFSLLSLTGITFFKILGVVLLLLCVVTGGFIGGFTIPRANYLKGGGMKFDRYLFSKCKKRFMKKKKILYASNISRDHQTIPYVYVAEKKGKKSKGREELPTLLETLKEIFGGVN